MSLLPGGHGWRLRLRPAMRRRRSAPAIRAARRLRALATGAHHRPRLELNTILARRRAALTQRVGLRMAGPVRLAAVAPLTVRAPAPVIRRALDSPSAARQPAIAMAQPAAVSRRMRLAVERVARVGTLRTLRIVRIPASPLLNANAPAGVPGAAGTPGRDGLGGTVGPAGPRGPAMVLRASALPLTPRVDEVPRTAPTTADSAATTFPAAASAAAAPPSIDEITTQVIRQIERRAVAQRERRARG